MRSGNERYSEPVTIAGLGAALDPGGLQFHRRRSGQHQQSALRGSYCGYRSM
jgi:hypothetical protein